MKHVALALVGCCVVPHFELSASEDLPREEHHDSLAVAPPEAVGMDSRRLNVIDEIVAGRPFTWENARLCRAGRTPWIYGFSQGIRLSTAATR